MVSYVYLRREGLEGYMADLNRMEREALGVNGDIEIEVLPYVPLIFDGLDEVG
jgi:hypothetical protein